MKLFKIWFRRLQFWRKGVGVLLVCCVCDVLLIAVVVAIFGGNVHFFEAKGSGVQGYSAASIL